MYYNYIARPSVSWLTILSPLKVFTGRNFKARTLRFFAFKTYLFLHNYLLFIFLNSERMSFVCELI